MLFSCELKLGFSDRWVLSLYHSVGAVRCVMSTESAEAEDSVG